MLIHINLLTQIYQFHKVQGKPKIQRIFQQNQENEGGTQCSLSQVLFRIHGSLSQKVIYLMPRISDKLIGIYEIFKS